MRFNLLGPLEMLDDDGPVALGGIRQRATLGFLLLHANKTVATSRLMNAVWGDQPPATARKVLQNAVAALRRTLATAATEHEVTLETSAPGYVLRVPTDCVDWYRHQALVELGRAELAAGKVESGVGRLREALGLWRGPVLADLAESGVRWPELSVIRGARLGVLEERVEAELAAGLHQQVVGELAAEAEAEPTRERLCGQLMLALYRCGRHADALTVYRRTRQCLVEDLGLDPGHELQQLEQAILNHEEALLLPGAQAGPEAVPAGAPADRPAPRTGPSRAGGPRAVESKENKLVSVLMTRAELDPLHESADDAECVADVLRTVDAIVHEEVRRHGGYVHGAIGSVRMALFGVPHTHEDDAESAVRAALAIRERTAALASLDATAVQLDTAAAVTTGQALVAVYRADGRTELTELTGSVLDQCQQTLAFVPPGTVRICEITLRASRHAFTCFPALDQLGGGHVTAARPEESTPAAPAPFFGRTRELDVLRGLMADVHLRQRGHLVTVFGEPGIGRSRLTDEFERVLPSCPGLPRHVLGRVASYDVGEGHGTLRQLVRSFAGIGPGDVPSTALDKLALAVERLNLGRPTSKWLLTELTKLAAPEEHAVRAPYAGQALTALRHTLEEAAAQRPLVVIVEDVHRAHDQLLDFIEELVGPDAAPMLVVATTRPELRLRRPRWGGGTPKSSTITLEPLDDGAADSLFEALLRVPRTSSVTGGESRIPAIGRSELRRCVGGNPRFAVEYARLLQSGVPVLWDRAAPGLSTWRRFSGVGGPALPIPQQVHSVIAARLDSLPAAEKAVLHDMAVFGIGVTAEVIAAMGERGTDEANHCLAQLERRDLVRRRPGRGATVATEYTFPHPLIGAVAYAQIPLSSRVARHHRAAAWLIEQGATHRGPPPLSQLPRVTAQPPPAGEVAPAGEEPARQVPAEDAPVTPDRPPAGEAHTTDGNGKPTLR
ncbi:BTAD domain-containing putative transcriptional regulator [Streptomyces sp. NBC_01506]|uniref:BTAD domain-containing putative transcriptional regulator n=1 Tax=Streptomyces sp. NBC_01506 TaxID=2903887 RepID=UPI00386FCDC8